MKERIKHGVHRIKKKTRAIYDAFDKKDVAQMLTSLFVIVQFFSFPISGFEFHQSLSLFFTSVVVCGIIVWLIAKNDFLDHLIAGILIVGIFSFLIGLVLNEPIENIMVAMTIGLPVATMVNVLKK